MPPPLHESYFGFPLVWPDPQLHCRAFFDVVVPSNLKFADLRLAEIDSELLSPVVVNAGNSRPTVHQAEKLGPRQSAEGEGHHWSYEVFRVKG